MNFLKGYHCRVIILQDYDPFFNLAVERYFFENIKQGEYLLLLWKSKPSIILGRFQNPWQEINTKLLAQEDVLMVRRISGGGCVYHDLENLNYCFISHGESWFRKEHCEFVLESLNSFGIEGLVTEKFDIHVKTDVGDKKVSGSAFKQSRKRHLHHGTLLINADLARLRTLLRPEKKQIQSKSIASRPHSVINLKELNKNITVEEVQNKLAESFIRYSEHNIASERLGEARLSNDDVSKYKQQLIDKQWLWGETPFFEQSIEFKTDWSEGSATIKSHKGKIIEFILDDGYFHPDVVEQINSELVHKWFQADNFKNAFHKVAKSNNSYTRELMQLADIIFQNVT